MSVASRRVGWKGSVTAALSAWLWISGAPVPALAAAPPADPGGDPVGGDPVGGDPVGGDPVGGDPVGGDPVGGDPVGGDPVGGDPVGGDPVGTRGRGRLGGAPDRDLELRFGTVLIGLSVGVFVTDHLELEAGLGVRNEIDTGYDLGFSKTLPIANAKLGIEAGLMLGAAWEQTWRRSWLLDGDELSWRAGVRWRTTALFESAALLLPIRVVSADVHAGVGITFPIYAGLTYTWWALPRRGPVLGLLSKLFDLGFFVRLEAGPDIGSFTTYVDDVKDFEELVNKGRLGPGRTAFPVVRAYYNFVIGLVI